MKLSLGMLAVVLSLIAIIISVIQPLYNLGRSEEEGEASFDIYGFQVFKTFTRLEIRNNGSATAHFMVIYVIFSGPLLPNWEMSESVSEIKEGTQFWIEIPIGKHQLESAIPEGGASNVTDYKCEAHIIYDEKLFPFQMSFYFEGFIE